MDKDTECIRDINRVLQCMVEYGVRTAKISPVNGRITYIDSQRKVVGYKLLDRSLYSSMTARLEVMAGIDITKRGPNVERGKIRILNHDFEVSTNSTPTGRHITLEMTSL